jgi:hypothetical protein
MLLIGCSFIIRKILEIENTKNQKVLRVSIKLMVLIGRIGLEVAGIRKAKVINYGK